MCQINTPASSWSEGSGGRGVGRIFQFPTFLLWPSPHCSQSSSHLTMDIVDGEWEARENWDLDLMKSVIVNTD